MRFALSTLALLTLALSADAAGIRHRSRTFVGPRGTTFHRESTSASFPVAPAGLEHTSAMQCLNAQRARLGLPPFAEDPALTAGAQACANARAQRCQFGHTVNDFGFLPPGAYADSGGAGCWDSYFGFMACGNDSRQHRVAGAGWARGPDGRVYCTLFVRRR